MLVETPWKLEMCPMLRSGLVSCWVCVIASTCSTSAKMQHDAKKHQAAQCVVQGTIAVPPFHGLFPRAVNQNCTHAKPFILPRTHHLRECVSSPKASRKRKRRRRNDADPAALRTITKGIRISNCAQSRQRRGKVPMYLTSILIPSNSLSASFCGALSSCPCG
jgi:hypothetical protein